MITRFSLESADQTALPAGRLCPTPLTASEAGTASFGALTGAKTPISAHDAALQLARAWQKVTGSAPNSHVVGVLWAQWALETGRGTAMRGYNFGGLKGTAPTGGSASLWTHEGHGATEHRIRSRFRTYCSAAEGAEDYVRTLADHYPHALQAASRGDPAAFVDALCSAGYFTANPAEYRASVGSLWREFQAAGPQRQRLPVVEAPNLAESALIWMLGRAITRREE